jgi:hypothetical protein
MLKAQPMFFDLEKLLVKREHFGWASGTRRRKTACGVRQNLVQMTGRFHRKFEFLFNLKSESQNPKFHLGWRRSHRLMMLSPHDGNTTVSCGEISISETK